jgi:membrane protein implicated in regulation of membrane protease activity
MSLKLKRLVKYLAILILVPSSIIIISSVSSGVTNGFCDTTLNIIYVASGLSAVSLLALVLLAGKRLDNKNEKESDRDN